MLVKIESQGRKILEVDVDDETDVATEEDDVDVEEALSLLANKISIF